MTWNLKEAEKTLGWRNFFNRIFFHNNQAEVSQHYLSHHIQGDQALLEQVLKPSAQRIFGDLQNYLVMKTTSDNPGIILICTANPGEGASSVALGLAVAATRDKQDKVLLIDGNFYHPSLCKAWGLTDNLGFFDLLTGATDNLNIAQQTRLGNLWVMGAGSSIESQSKDLEPGNLKEILTQLANLYTLVIIDGPPLNNHPESNLYAQYATNTLLVIAAGLSRAPVVHNAIAKFPPQVRDTLEVVLNRRIYPIPDGIYRKLWTS